MCTYIYILYMYIYIYIYICISVCVCKNMKLSIYNGNTFSNFSSYPPCHALNLILT